jgi:beta-N-acetylhexosaminidase
MAALGHAGDEALAGRFARAMARELAAVGITFDFAPVLDVLTNPANPAIGDRAISGRPDVVSRLGCAIIDAIQGEGLAACGKHFPGHGDASVDSHHDLPVPASWWRTSWCPRSTSGSRPASRGPSSTICCAADCVSAISS